MNMNMKRLKYIISVALIMAALPAAAQFYVTGDDPGKARWYSVETENFKIIYPEGADSLAKVYARKIEQYRIPVSLTSGYVSGEGKGVKMPVVMHAYNAANGSVAWAPKRMDLFTLPSAYNPEPMPWSTMLSVHESRHVTQMQFGLTKALKPGNWIFGEMWNILASLIYPGISNMEGDAVITETAWTPSGRGRTADFLNYYWVAFDNGDFRKWDKWRFVSQKHNAPNYYALGYLTIGGFRYLYDCPEYMSYGYHLAAKKPYNLGAFYTTAKRLTGKKFDDAFLEVCDTLYTLWSADAEARKPYIVSEPVTPETRMYTDYTDNLVVGDDIYAVKKGHVNVPTLVRIDSTGREHRLSSFGYEVSRPQWSEELGRLYWSETKADERWTLKTESKIRYMDIASGGRKTLKNRAMLHNPAPSGENVATVRYEIGGKSAVDIIDASGGGLKQSFAAPDSLQLVELAWIGDVLYASAVSDNGYGVYGLQAKGPAAAEDDSAVWTEVLAPQPVMIKDFNSYGNELMFTCDRTGVNELYHLNPSDGALRQKTSTRYGSEDFCYSSDGEWLYYSSQTLGGKRIFRTPVSRLTDRSSDFGKLYKYPIAEKVTAQEKAAAMEAGPMIKAEDVHVSEPQKYRKLAHMFNVHSWAPVYVNVNNIMNMNFSQIWQAASLGAAGIMQNRLSTMTGEFGYSAHKDPYDNAHWRHSGHIRLTYSGLYPVLEASLDFNDRAARQYSTYAYIYNDGGVGMEMSSRAMATPYIEGKLSAYIPFRFSSGGWFKGITPRVTYRIGNDMFNQSIAVMKMEEHISPAGDGMALESQLPVFAGSTEGKNTFRHSISASLGAYILQNTPSSAVYPRWGFSAEIGASEGIDSRKILSPMGYAFLQGYLPGIMREQGLKLSALGQVKLDKNAFFGQATVSILPRGLSSNALLASWLSIRASLMGKFTADYAIPIFIGDLAIGGSFFSIKRLVLTPHFDATLFPGSILGVGGTLRSGGTAPASLWSAGATLDLNLHSILTLEWPVTIGVTFSWNSGSAFSHLSGKPSLALNRYYIGPNFNVTF